MNQDNLIEVRDLCVEFVTGEHHHRVVNNVSFDIKRGETLALVGESGSGKSVTAHSILRLLPYPLARHPAGTISYAGQDLLTLKEKTLRHIRGNRIAMIFQEPMTSLNPLHTIEKQINEVLGLHKGLTGKVATRRTLELLELVGIPEPHKRLKALPHELSGGQRQRVVIAMALAFDPALLIADEPTSALDVTTQAQILDLLRKIQQDKGMALLFITHDFAVVEAIADRVLVLEKGVLVEQGSARQVLREPKAAYTRQLLAAVSAEPLAPRGSVEGPVVLRAEQLGKVFRSRSGWWGKRTTLALDAVQLELREGETLGIVGESGSGKSTLGRCLVRLLRADSGHIQWLGQDVAELSEARLRPLRSDVQMIFQDPFASLNPRQTVGRIIMTGPLVQGHSKSEAEQRARDLLTLVGLPATAFERYPHEFSGGQRQRIGIARALAVDPKVLIADECVSALDALIQVQILELLESLQRRLKLSIVFITHDLRVAARLCDRIAVMQNGRVVEQGETAGLFADARHPYTRTLLQCVPTAPVFEPDAI